MNEKINEIFIKQIEQILSLLNYIITIAKTLYTFKCINLLLNEL